MPERKEHHKILTPSFLQSVPNNPGVYLMKNSTGKVVYVGKAKDLRKRLSSYARFQGEEHSKTRVLVSRIAGVETILTLSEKEALILEASLIKKYRPKYNVILRDDKNYPFIKITVNETWPRIVMTRRRSKDKARYFGPFSSIGAMWATIRLLHSLFPLRRCKGTDVKERSRPCLNFQMKKCLGPCVGKADPDRYRDMVRDVIMVLEGKNRELANRLKEKMHNAAFLFRFEDAALFRDQLAALNDTLEKQIVAGGISLELDVFGYERKGPSVAVSVLSVREGRVLGQQAFFLAEPVGGEGEILAEVIRRYYIEADFVAREVIFPFLPDDLDLLTEWLSEMRNGTVTLRVPLRGDKLRLVGMAQANASQVFSERDKREKTWSVLADQLAKVLHLNRRPERIECLDISNISGRQAVGSLVCFQKGEKFGAGYRHYRIKSGDEPDDYRMMAEVITRRLERGLTENNLPDLFMVDGGKGQLNIAVNLVRDFGLDDKIELAGIAKEKGNEGEKLYRPGRKNAILLPRHAPPLLFLMKIRDEAHRYGITFHRKLRQKEAFTSSIDTIPGVGPERKKKLLTAFGSLAGVKKASVEELSKIPGISTSLACAIHDFLQMEP
ncbi:MAG: excinuclease ABC subunit UvrC [Pseudomonadota bacterium]